MTGGSTNQERHEEMSDNASSEPPSSLNSSLRIN